MFKKLLAVVMIAFLASTAQARGQNGQEDETSSPLKADAIYRIGEEYIMHRQDGYMLVCVNKTEKKVMECSSKSKDLLTFTLEDFWKWNFPAAPTLRVIGMDYRSYHASYVFWLKR